MESEKPVITSRQNARVKELVKLRQRRQREVQQRFLVEGQLEVQRALESGRTVMELYYCEAFFRDKQACRALVEQAQVRGASLWGLSESVFEKVSVREGADGLLAVVASWELVLEALPLSACPLLVVAEAIEKPGNLGSLIRSAEAAGADGLIVCDPVTDVFNPNVVRASRGLVCRKPIALASPETVAAFLEARGIQTVALMPQGEITYWDVDWQRPSAILAGSEWAGLSSFWKERAQVRAFLPMVGAGDSLNVSMATVATLYEALRQRSL